jgi:hypothetical protein
MLKNTHTRTLAQISQKIKAVEKRKLISGIVEIGKLLREGERLCEHGEYVAWIRREFSWSHQTALNYRNVFDLTQNPNHLDFDKLNITQSALYLVAGMKGDHEKVARKAIINTAKRRRVTFPIACEIIDKFEELPPLKPPSSSPPPSFEEPPIEPIEGEGETPPSGSPPPDRSPPIDQPTEDLNLKDGGVAFPRSEQPAAPNPELMAALSTVSRYSLHFAVWPEVIEAIGLVKLRGIIEALNAIYETHCDKNVVKAKADRAADRARGLH